MRWCVTYVPGMRCNPCLGSLTEFFPTMPDPVSNRILYPVFAMFALVIGVFLRMAQVRFGAVRRGEMNPAFYRTYQGDEEPEHMRVVTRHFINLFEMPVLFYVVVVLTYVSHQTGTWMTLLAWAYVASRYFHTFVHLGSNDVLLRFRVYLGSALVLVTLWASLFVKLVTS
jgi:hypothetical protein